MNGKNKILRFQKEMNGRMRSKYQRNEWKNDYVQAVSTESTAYQRHHVNGRMIMFKQVNNYPILISTALSKAPCEWKMIMFKQVNNYSYLDKYSPTKGTMNERMIMFKQVNNYSYLDKYSLPKAPCEWKNDYVQAALPKAPCEWKNDYVQAGKTNLDNYGEWKNDYVQAALPKAPERMIIATPKCTMLKVQPYPKHHDYVQAAYQRHHVNGRMIMFKQVNNYGIPILISTALPKAPCEWKNDYVQAGNNYPYLDKYSLTKGTMIGRMIMFKQPYQRHLVKWKNDYVQAGNNNPYLISTALPKAPCEWKNDYLAVHQPKAPCEWKNDYVQAGKTTIPILISTALPKGTKWNERMIMFKQVNNNPYLESTALPKAPCEWKNDYVEAGKLQYPYLESTALPKASCEWKNDYVQAGIPIFKYSPTKGTMNVKNDYVEAALPKAPCVHGRMIMFKQVNNYSIPIFKVQPLPKAPCEWKNDYVQAGNNYSYLNKYSPTKATHVNGRMIMFKQVNNYPYLDKCTSLPKAPCEWKNDYVQQVNNYPYLESTALPKAPCEWKNDYVEAGALPKAPCEWKNDYVQAGKVTIPILISTALPKAPCEWKNDYVQAGNNYSCLDKYSPTKAPCEWKNDYVQAGNNYGIPILISTAHQKAPCEWKNDYVQAGKQLQYPYLESTALPKAPCEWKNDYVEAALPKAPCEWKNDYVQAGKQLFLSLSTALPKALPKAPCEWKMIMSKQPYLRHHVNERRIMFKQVNNYGIPILIIISTALPKAPCEWKNDYVQADFSFLGFLKEKGIDVNDNLDVNQASALIERLAIGNLLKDTQCSTSLAPYSGHTHGWTNSCGQPMATLPTISGVVCNVGSDCTSVHCCLSDTRIGKRFETFVKFDPCLFRLRVGIEKLTFSTLLFDYEWGQLNEVWLFGYVRMEFTVRDLEMEGDYLIDMKLQICRESDTDTTPCGVDVVIFDKYRLPKLSCDWNSGLYTGFQGLATWLTDNSVTKTEPLRGPETFKLMSDSGIAAYLYEPPCDQLGSTYYGNVGGVKNDCGKPVSVPVLPSGVVCTVSMDTCTGLECCITIPLTNKTMNFRININHCYQDITVGLESMNRQYKLLDYSFGTMEHFNLRGVCRMEYKIEDFIGKRAYLMDISFSFCLETGSCEFTETIIQGVKFPKKKCTWDDTYRVKDCSDTEVIAISTNPITCKLKSDCAAINCCLDEVFINKTFEVFFEINHCERKIYIGIEKLKFYIPLHDFEFDKWHEFSLVKTIRIRYNLYDLWSEGVYLVSLEISSCWEMYSRCDWTQSVLDYARFKKQTCAPQMAYQNADIINNNDSNEKKERKKTAQQNEGRRSCGSTINNLPMLSSGTSCYISDVCTDVRCCVSVPFFGNHTFDFSLNLDGCTQYMVMSLENYKEQFMLSDFNFGQEDYLWIKGVFRLKYTIDDLPDQNLYRVSVMFEVCTTNGAPCEYSLTVMDSVELPRSSCLPEWGYGYAEVGFTKEQWKTRRGLGDDAILNYWQIAKILEDTEIAFYQNKPRCNHTMGDYQGSVDGWVINCTLGVSPGVLDGDIVCLIGSKCSEVSCCVNDPETRSDFNAYLSLDPCEFILLVGVEKYSFEVSLIDFDFEKSYELDLGGIYKVSFSVNDLMYSGMYVVNMTVSICWSSGKDCQFVSQVFQNTLLPKHTCDTQTNFAQSECELGMIELPDISPAANCTLQPHCTAVDCSMFSPRLGRSFHASVDIDPCYAHMMVQIEKMNSNVRLLEKQYGMKCSVNY
ncbi:unnamed protein product [Mytilus edulis]|uniref:Uncharacterized protein n=1 Tax=Mytilus edulis TaxID=6550 RepID=A0A8S3V246_MYTED|nr:unnamed protein product [Mytilus edulis]